MEIKGEEFIRKVQIQQEREELEQKLSEIEEIETSLKGSVIKEEPIATTPIEEDINDIKLETNEFDDLVLEESNTNEENKKKYLILVLVLVILFLLSLIVYRLFTDDSSTQEDPFTQERTNPIVKNTTENIKEDDYQKIIKKKLEEDKRKEKQKEQNSEEKINNIEENISDETLDETIQKLEKKKTPKKPKVQKQKIEKKPIAKKPKKDKKSIKELLSSSKPRGYFVQIGAFAKKPSNSYINKIRKAGLKYTIYRVKVKGKMYNKVLIGPYSSKANAKNNTSTIKNKLDISSTYIVKF